jgi:SpoVK/Ycf46/Vps4 family AAA+-type ATPase
VQKRAHAAPFADNAEYLELACARVRACVERAVAVAEGKPAEAETLAERARALAVELAARVEGATPEVQATLGLPSLQKRLALADDDAAVLMHAAAAQLDPSLGKLHTKLSGTAFHPWLDVGIAVQVEHDGVADRLRARSRFQPDAPLVRHRLIALDRTRPDAKDNLVACELKLPPRVARVILGGDPTGGASTYARLLTPDVELDSVVLPDTARAELEQLLAAQAGLTGRLSEWGYDTLLPSGRAVVVLFTGAPGTGKTMLATALARRLGKKLLAIDGPRLADAGRALETELDELFVEARLADAVVLFDSCEVLFGGRGAGNPRAAALMRALDRFDGLVILATSAPERLDPTLDRRVMLRLPLEVPTGAMREQIWRALLLPSVPLDADVDVNQIAKRYELSGGSIRSAVLYAVSKAVARGVASTLTSADLDAAAQAQLRGDLSAWAERTTHARLTLDVLVLPSDEKSQIEEIIAAGRNRGKVLHTWGFNEKLPTGKGLVVLLSGEPGTGKTLAAEVIASELALNLYRVNPAKVVSKFVGETEKNLNEILAQAKSTHAILFFDEADALFSSRVAKVETANDRFVNMETNFLLQQLERYEGIVILATNLETSIDQAFKRRIAYHIVVPFPKPIDRERIWRTLMPSRAPVGKIDYPRLGKTFELSGGHIKNAILRAAYLAAQRDQVIDYDLLSEAAEKECAAAGKLFQHVSDPPVPPPTVKHKKH